MLRYRPFCQSIVEDLVGNVGIWGVYTNISYNAGDERFYIATPDNVSTFTVNYARPIYIPGFAIYQKRRRCLHKRFGRD